MKTIKYLSDFYDFQYGKGNNNPDNGGQYPVYGSNGIIGWYDKYNSEDAPVIGHIGANCGSVVWASGKHYVTYNGVICKIKSRVNSRFAYYTLLNSHLETRTRGAAQPFISYDLLNRVAVYAPVIETQNKIASILSTYDTLIENNNRRIRLLEQMAESLYKEWFVRFRFPGYKKVEMENGLPKGWEFKRLFEIASITYGYAFRSNKFCCDKSLNAVVRIRDIQSNHTETYTDERCDEKYLIKQNALLIGMDGVFHMCLWNGERAYLNQRVVMLNSKNNVFCNYILYHAVKPQIKYWEQVIVGTTVAHLGDKHLKRVKILFPDARTLMKTNKVIENIMNKINSLQKQNTLLTRQRDLLLPRLMSGKLEVKP